MDRFSELIISRSSVESLSQQEITPLMVGFTWRSKIWRQPQQLIQVGLIQSIGAMMIFTIGMIPVDRIFNSSNSLQSPQARMERLIWVDGAMSIGILSGVNWWMFERGKRLQRLIKLVEQIEDYNRIIHSISTLAKVANLTGMDRPASQTTQIFEVLSQSRHNLLTAVEIDRYLRQHPHPRSAALTSMAHNLINLQHLAQQPELSEYQDLLAQAWEIGMSVYHETNPDLRISANG